MEDTEMKDVSASDANKYLTDDDTDDAHSCSQEPSQGFLSLTICGIDDDELRSLMFPSSLSVAKNKRYNGLQDLITLRLKRLVPSIFLQDLLDEWLLGSDDEEKIELNEKVGRGEAKPTEWTLEVLPEDSNDRYWWPLTVDLSDIVSVFDAPSGAKSTTKRAVVRHKDHEEVAGNKHSGMWKTADSTWKRQRRDGSSIVNA